jgi:hypothetical protein
VRRRHRKGDREKDTGTVYRRGIQVREKTVRRRQGDRQDKEKLEGDRKKETGEGDRNCEMETQRQRKGNRVWGREGARTKKTGKENEEVKGEQEDETESTR